MRPILIARLSLVKMEVQILMPGGVRIRSVVGYILERRMPAAAARRQARCGNPLSSRLHSRAYGYRRTGAVTGVRPRWARRLRGVLAPSLNSRLRGAQAGSRPAQPPQGSLDAAEHRGPLEQRWRARCAANTLLRAPLTLAPEPVATPALDRSFVTYGRSRGSLPVRGRPRAPARPARLRPRRRSPDGSNRRPRSPLWRQRRPILPEPEGPPWGPAQGLPRCGDGGPCRIFAVSSSRQSRLGCGRFAPRPVSSVARGRCGVSRTTEFDISRRHDDEQHGTQGLVNGE
jgi:hypothetical protein